MFLKEYFKKKFHVGTGNEQKRIAWIKEKISELSNGLVLLDAGAGEQYYKQYCSHLKYISQDFGQYDGSGNGRGLQMGSWNNDNLDIVSDIINIPLPDESIDVILCVEVFEHIPDPVRALDEFTRLLKKNGKLILTAPFCMPTHFAPYYFYSGFSNYFYIDNLKKRGFEIKEIKANGNYFEYLAQEIRRLPSVANAYSTRKFRYIYNFLTAPLVMLLQFLSNNDKNSSELTAYGYLVVAQKND